MSDMPLELVLQSSVFAGCLDRANELAVDQARLRDLIVRVGEHKFGDGPLTDANGRIHVDIACAMVEAHIEELVSLADPGTAGEPRCISVIAALLYLIMVDDIRPDHGPGGELDDVALVRWAADEARRRLDLMSAQPSE